MSTNIKNAWNAWSDGYYQKHVPEHTINRIKENPWRAFPSVVRDMLQSAFADFRGLNVLVPSSGDNCAVIAFHLLGAQVTSADISERQLANAKQVTDANGWDIAYLCADSMTLEGVPDGAYDLVYTSNGVHVWIDDLPAMYRNFHRVLKPDGHYIMYEVHPFHRPFADESPRKRPGKETNPSAFEQKMPPVKVIKPYDEILIPGDPENYHWRVQDFVNGMTGQGLQIEHMEEFRTEADSELFLWWYQSAAEAEADGYQKLDWKHNPMAALPDWIGISAKKD